jgi:hypothetical protein
MSEGDKSEGDETKVDSGNKGNSWCDPKIITQAILIPIILLAATQLINTLLPIMYGPSDTSDFSIIAEPPDRDLTVKDPYVLANITVEDVRGWLRPYRHTVHLYSPGIHNGYTLEFSPNDEKPPFESEMTIIPISPRNDIREEVTITGLGGDGKKRNTTFLLTIVGSSYYSKNIMPERTGIPLNFSPRTENISS